MTTPSHHSCPFRQGADRVKPIVASIVQGSNGPTSLATSRLVVCDDHHSNLDLVVQLTLARSAVATSSGRGFEEAQIR